MTLHIHHLCATILDSKNGETMVDKKGLQVFFRPFEYLECIVSYEGTY